jgi:hypothetical protein
VLFKPLSQLTFWKRLVTVRNGDERADSRGGNVTRVLKTSAPPRLAIYLPKGIFISKVELSYRGSSVTTLVMELNRVTPGG